MVSDNSQKDKPAADHPDRPADKPEKKSEGNWLSGEIQGIFGFVKKEVKQATEAVGTLVSSVESWTKVDDHTIRSKGGNTVKLVDSTNKDKATSQLFDYDWNQPLNWSDLVGPQPSQSANKAASGDPAQKQAADKTTSSSDSSRHSWIEDLFSGKELLQLFGKNTNGSETRADAKGDQKQPEPGKDFTQLGDGTKVSRDGSIEFSAAAEKARDSGQDVVHEWKDTTGKHKLEIKNHVVYYDNTEISDSKIIRKNGDQTTTLDKKTGTTDVQNSEGHFRQTRTSRGAIRTTRLQGDNYQYSQLGDGLSIQSATDGQQLAEQTERGLVARRPGSADLVLVHHGQSAEALAKQHRDKHDIFLDAQGHMGTYLKDGTFVRFVTAVENGKQVEIVSLAKGDTEVQITADGKHMRLRHGQGEWQAVPEDKIPEGLRKRIAGHVVKLDGDQQFDFKSGRLLTGNQVDWERGKDGKCVLHINNGPDVKQTDKHFELTNPDHPDKKPVIWDPEKHVLSTAIGTVSAEKTVFKDGDEIYIDGTIRWRNADGTYDLSDRHGNFRSSGGFNVTSDMRVNCPDGYSYNVRGGDASVIGSPAHAMSAADQASAVAAAVEGKAMVDFNDVGMLTDAQGNVAMLIATCMGSGDLQSVATLMAAEARLDGALSFALGRAQACAIANQMGVFSPTLIQEMENNIYGKTPLQAVQSDLDFHGLRKHRESLA